MAMSMAEEERSLVRLCIESATESAESVDKWRRQRRTLERMPSHLSSPLLHRLLHRRILSPSLLEIFQHSVEEVDLKGENCVDAEWMSYIGGFRHLRALNLAGCRGITNSALWPITGMTNLVDLDLSRCSKITDACVGHLLSISNLKKLYLSETGLTTDGVRNLSCLKSLCVLDLGGLPVTDMALFWFQELTELEHLELWGSKISNRGAALLETFPKLSFLNVAWTDVTHLPMLPSVTCLNISRCNIHSIYGGELNVTVPLSKLLASGTTFLNINLQFAPVEADDLSCIDLSGSSVDNFHFLGHMKALEHLNLSFGAMSDDLMWPLSRIGEKLRYLNLNNTKVTKIGLCIISSNVLVLETLLLSHTFVDDDALLYIHSMPSLREIDLSNTKIKGFTLSLLQNLTHLQSLNLEQTLVTDEALHLLSVLQELKCLYLKSEILSDVSLHVLSSLPKLTSIGFRGTVLSNAGLQLFSPPPMLQVLDIRGCWLLTEDVVQSFHISYPQIDLRHEFVHSHLATAGQYVVPSKLKGGKSSQASRTFQRQNFVDERLKYNREELLELQFSHLLSLSLNSSKAVLPKMLLKDSSATFLSSPSLTAAAAATCLLQ